MEKVMHWLSEALPQAFELVKSGNKGALVLLVMVVLFAVRREVYEIALLLLLLLFLLRFLVK